MTTSLHEIHCRYVNGFSFTSVIVLKLSLAKRNLRGKVIHCYEMKKMTVTRLLVHYEIYKERLNKYQVTLKGAMESFFSAIIHRNNNNARTLIATAERLTTPSVTVLPELNSTRACNEFASFFTEKILNIRRSISTSAPTLIPSMSTINTHAEKMTNF